MSDDEYYAGSPYDDFEDMLWDADPSPDLADDLAQHAAYSPVWQDDPTGELEAYHSDWEYYSDDYYDDDPSILKDNPVDGSPVHSKSMNKAQTLRRGKKRKHEDIGQRPDTDEVSFLAKTIQGTVWASGTSPTTKIFQEGQQETVGLLVDWKEKFKLDNGKSRTFGQGQLKRDESWANDLSLVDMGLTHVRERTGAKNGVDDEAGNAILGDEEEEEDQGEEHDDFDDMQDIENFEPSVSGESRLAVLPDSVPRQNGHQQRRKRSRDQNQEQSDHEAMSETDPGNHLPDGKRRKVSASIPPSQAHRRGSAASNRGNPRPKSDPLETGDPIQAEQHDRAKKEQRAAESGESDALGPQKNASRDHNGNGSKKRRLSSDQEDSPGTTTPTTGRHSKRVASGKLHASQNSQSKDETHTPVTRSMRLRKK